MTASYISTSFRAESPLPLQSFIYFIGCADDCVGNSQNGYTSKQEHPKNAGPVADSPAFLTAAIFILTEMRHLDLQEAGAANQVERED